MKITAFVLLMCLSASWAALDKKIKRGVLLASGNIEIGGEHVDIPSVPSLPLESGFHSSGGFEVAAGGFASGAAVGVGPIEDGAIGGADIGGEATGPLSGPDQHANIAHYHLGHSVQRHVSVLHRIGIPFPQPYQVPVERPIPVQVPTPVDVPVDRPYPVHVPRPYEVKVYKDVPVEVDQPISVPVQVPVHINVPHPVKVEQHVPVPVHIVKKVPVPVPHPVIVKQKVPVAIHAFIQPVHVHGHAHAEVHHGHHGWE